MCQRSGQRDGDAEVVFDGFNGFIVFDFAEEDKRAIEAGDGGIVVSDIAVCHAHEIEGLSDEYARDVFLSTDARIEFVEEGSEGSIDGFIIAVVVGGMCIIEEFGEEVLWHAHGINACGDKIFDIFDIVDE